jgi:hypothetical protein
VRKYAIGDLFQDKLHQVIFEVIKYRSVARANEYWCRLHKSSDSYWGIETMVLGEHSLNKLEKVTDNELIKELID